ncbi:MAG TPA: hypothetical protein VLA89_19310, partial [Gemmatimonadales bacterium]|nr:hypothetical protein [Gemmatimonadales bacterium]
VSNTTDAEAIANAVVADTTRWGLAHLAIGVGYALLVLAFLASRSYLHEGGEERWSRLALPLAAIGSALFASFRGWSSRHRGRRKGSTKHRPDRRYVRRQRVGLPAQSGAG